MNEKSFDSQELQRKLSEGIDHINNLINSCKGGSASLIEIDKSIRQISSYFNSLRNQWSLLGDQYILPDSVFETFVEGDCNKLARFYAISATEKSKHRLFNPLIIIGAVGLGKTHLLHAIVNKVRRNNPENGILYFQAEDFCEQLVNSVKNNRINEFIGYLSELDTLLIDDIHCFAGKEKTQEILVQIIDHLLSRDRQVIFSTLILPAEIKQINDRLLSRILKGVALTLGMADSQTLGKILTMKAQRLEREISDSMLTELLSIEHNCIREAEGHLIRLITINTLPETNEKIR